MTGLQDFRREHPEYDDMTDVDLANALHSKFYSDIPRNEYYKTLGIETVPTQGGEQRPTSAPSVASRLAKGFLDPFEAGAQMLETGVRAIPFVGPKAVDAINAANNVLARYGVVAPVGTQGVAADIAAREKAYQASLPEEFGIDWARMAGNIASPANLALGTAAPVGIASRAATGAASGALSAPVSNMDNFLTEKALQAGLGTAVPAIAPAVGKLMTGAGRTITRTISPLASRANSDTQRLLAEGVQPTTGQMLGGGWAKAEEKAMSIPLVGDLIANRRAEAIDQYNRGALQQAGRFFSNEPIEGVGQSGIRSLDEAASAAYGKFFDEVPDVFVTFPTSNFLAKAENLTDPMKDRANKFVNNIVLKSLDNAKRQGLPDGYVTGEQFKKLDSEIRALATKYSKSVLASEKDLGDLLKEFRRNMRQEVPTEFRTRLAELDKGFAAKKVLEKASENAKGAEGVFSPAQLQRAADAAPRQLGYGQMAAKGEGLLQDYGNLGRRVLGANVPDSGTVGRGLLTALLFGEALNIPLWPAMMGSALYSPLGQAASRRVLAQRGPWAEATAGAIDAALANRARDLQRISPYLAAPLAAELAR